MTPRARLNDGKPGQTACTWTKHVQESTTGKKKGECTWKADTTKKATTYTGYN
jgi:hypothetical protein